MQRESLTGWRRTVRYYYLRLLRLQSTPKAIARGLAVGVFAGSFPIFGFQTIVALGLAIPFKGNKFVAALGTWVSNPFTYVPIFFFNYRVGRWILGSSTPLTVEGNLQDWMNLGMDVTLTLFVGCAFVGLIGSVCSYFIGLQLAQFLQERRREKIVR